MHAYRNPHHGQQRFFFGFPFVGGLLGGLIGGAVGSSLFYPRPSPYPPFPPFAPYASYPGFPPYGGYGYGNPYY